jgi:hypothetical protein
MAKNKNSSNSEDDDFMPLLDAINLYKMDKLESAAYKLCIIWIEKSRKFFPTYDHTRMRRGDPRKSLMFKVCYKFVRETQGILDEEDYPLYVRAQLDILKNISLGSDEHPLIEPNVLVGEKAWKRWKLWKLKYDSVVSQKGFTVKITASSQKVLDALEKTKEFIFKNLGPEPSLEKFRESVINKNLFRWIGLGKISPYYLCLSPYFKKLVSEEDMKKITFDLEIYRQCLNDELIALFEEKFKYEF